MALTWRDVAAPSFSGASQAQQGSGIMLDRALSGLSNGLQQFAADRQAGVDSALLARSMQYQDPAKLREALSTGSLLDGVDLSRVNPKVLESVNNQVGQLLNQAATQQNIDSSKTSQAATQQNIDFNKQDQTRKTQQQMLEDAARPELARRLGLTGALATQDLTAQQQLAKTFSGLTSDKLNQDGQRISNATGSFNLATSRRNDAAGQDAIGAVTNALSNSATTEDLLSQIESTKFKSPQAKLAAIEQVKKVTGVNPYAPIDAQVASTGSHASGTGKGKPAVTNSFDASSASSPEARDALLGLGRTLSQNNTNGVLADVEANLNDKRPAPEVAQEVAKLFPEVDHAKLSGLITEQISKNPGLSAADVASALKRSTTSNWLGSTRFGGGIGVDDASFKSNLTDMATGKADYMSAGNEIVRSAISTIKSADSGLSSAEANLSKLRQLQKAKPGIDTSAAEDRVARSQQALTDAITRYRDNPALHPVYAPQVKPQPQRMDRGR